MNSYISNLGLVPFVALLLAVAIHEMGHIAAIYVLGLRTRGIYVELSGLRIDYIGDGTVLSDISIALAGPMIGLIYAFLADKAAGDLMNISSQISIFYSLLNYLPVGVLDGGRVFASVMDYFFCDGAGSVVSKTISLSVCSFLIILGLWFVIKGEGSGLFAFSLWLLLLES